MANQRIIVREVSGKPIPGAAVTFYERDATGNLGNLLVTMKTDDNGQILLSNPEYFTESVAAEVSASGYGTYITEAQFISGDPSYITLEKRSNLVPALLVGAALIFGFYLYQKKK